MYVHKYVTTNMKSKKAAAKIHPKYLKFNRKHENIPLTIMNRT